MCEPPWIADKRTFLPNSKLQDYLARKQSQYINHFTNTFEYNTILNVFKMEIARERMYDENNPVILSFNAELEEIFGTKFCHCNEFPKILDKHFVVPNKPTWKKTSDPPPREDFLQPTWSPSNNKYLEISNSVPKDFDTDCKYKLKPEMYELLEEFLPKNEQDFLYFDICQALSKYIKKWKDQIIYPKNNYIAVIRGTPLAKIFGMNTISRIHVGLLIRSQCIPL